MTLPSLVVLASIFVQASPDNAPPPAAGPIAHSAAPTAGASAPPAPAPSLDAPSVVPSVDLSLAPTLVPPPAAILEPPAEFSAPARRPFTRTAAGMSLAIASGWAVALPSTALMHRYAPDPAFPNLGGAALDIGLVITAIGASCVAPVLTSSAVDGPTDSPVSSYLGLGAGALVGFGVAEGISENVSGLSPHTVDYLGMAAIPLWATIGYYWVHDSDAERVGASTRVKRKLALAFLLGGDTIGGSGIEAAFHASDRLALALQVISGDGAGTEGSLRLQFFALALPRSGLFLAAGPHLTAGNARDDVASFQDKPAAAAGALAAVGWQFRGEHGFLFQAEVSTVYAPSAHNIRQVSGATIFPGGAVMLGYAR